MPKALEQGDWSLPGFIRYTLASAVLLIVIAVAWPATCEPIHHALSVSLFPQDNSLRAVDSVCVGPEVLKDGWLNFLINKNLVVETVTSGTPVTRWYTEEDIDPRIFKAQPDSEDVEFIGRAKGLFVELGDIDPAVDRFVVAIGYAGVIIDSLKGPAQAYARGFGETTGLIEERGVFLTNESLWYPFQFERMFTFSLKADVPWDWMTVSQGRRADEYVARLHGEDRVVDVWIEDSPTPDLYLVAGRYYRHEASYNGTWIMTYTYQQSDSLSQVYLDATKRYIGMYERLLGDYPFAKFAMVENFWQTGYGMPSFTLLGSKVIRLPFIVHTSYGHEILHNWWGNSVYVDYDRGNWCEGITTYGADYLYKKHMGENAARDYRHQTLMAFSNYVTEGRDFPLSEFHERHDSASQSVGYGKSLMVYHMLHESLGDSLFWECLRELYDRTKFTIASWDDIEAVFSEVSGRDLSWYFGQWLTRTGAPTLRLATADYRKAAIDPESGSPQGEAAYEVTFTLEQDSPAFRLDVPVTIETEHGRDVSMVHLDGPAETYTVATKAEPTAIAVDPDYNMFRNLYLEEIPITLGTLFGRNSVLVVIGSDVPDSTVAGFLSLADTWGLRKHTVRENEMAGGDLAGKHLWLLGRGSLIDEIIARKSDLIPIQGGIARLDDGGFTLAGNTLVCTLRNPDDENLGVGIILCEDLPSLMALAPRLVHYGSYSYIGFTGTRPTLKGVWPERQSPLTVNFGTR